MIESHGVDNDLDQHTLTSTSPSGNNDFQNTRNVSSFTDFDSKTDFSKHQLNTLLHRRQSDSSDFSPSASMSSLRSRFGITPMSNKLFDKSSSSDTSGTITPYANTSGPSIAKTTYDLANADLNFNDTQKSHTTGSSTKNSLRRLSAAY